VKREWHGFHFLEAFNTAPNTAPDVHIEETEFRKVRRAKRLHEQKSLQSKGTVKEATIKQKIVNKVGAFENVLSRGSCGPGMISSLGGSAKEKEMWAGGEGGGSP
jgi:hypothetical protein